MNSQELRLATYQMAAKYGAFMGLFLIVRYMAETLSHTYGALAWLYLLLTVAVPFVAYKLARVYKAHLNNPDMGFGDYYRFTFYLFFFSSIILTFVQYIYYRYISPEYIDNLFQYLMNSADVLIANNSPYSAALTEYKELIAQQPKPTAFDMAIPTIWIYLIVGVVLGLLNASILNRQKN